MTDAREVIARAVEDIIKANSSAYENGYDADDIYGGVDDILTALDAAGLAIVPKDTA